RSSQAPHEDVTERRNACADRFLPTLGELAGFIVCAKSPSCGMERVRLYDEKGNRGRKAGTGLLSAAMMDYYHWVPIEEGG
ncbi:DUF1722 domain-containing protein, partial [Salmonella enterica subsp. enterica serovar Wilhelmsburg]